MAADRLITVDYHEVDGSPRESVGYDRPFAAQRTLRCAWEDRLELYKQLQGSYLDTDTGEWIRPSAYPWRDSCRVVRVSMAPWTNVTGESVSESNAAVYEYAILTVDYATTSAGFTPEGTQTLVEHSLTAGAEFITRPAEGAIWWHAENDAVQTDEAPGVLTGTVQWAVVVHEVQVVPVTVYSLVGHVNQADIAAAYLPENAGFVALKETLRYDGPSVDPEITADGDYRWRVTLKFSRKYGAAKNVESSDLAYAGWNHFFAPGAESAERMWTSSADRTVPGAIYKPYPLSDISAMLAAVGVG